MVLQPVHAPAQYLTWDAFYLRVCKFPVAVFFVRQPISMANVLRLNQIPPSRTLFVKWVVGAITAYLSNLLPETQAKLSLFPLSESPFFHYYSDVEASLGRPQE